MLLMTKPLSAEFLLVSVEVNWLGNEHNWLGNLKVQVEHIVFDHNTDTQDFVCLVIDR